jgi:hypothetical protein
MRLSELTAGYHGRESKTRPFTSASWEANQSHQKGEAPKFTKYAVKCTFIKVLTTTSKENHENDLEDRRRNREHVAVKSREADTFKSEGEVCLDRCSWNVCNKPDEVETPHRRVRQAGPDITEANWLCERG